MWRRHLDTLGQQATEDLVPMSPPAGFEAQTPETRAAGGLAGVLRGLTRSKSTRALSSQRSSTAISNSSPLPSDASAASVPLPAFPPGQRGLFERLRSGNLNERVAAAETLCFTIADYPLSPVIEIWDAAKDLTEPSRPRHVREVGWSLLTQCVKHAYSTDLERRGYFVTIAAPASLDDLDLQLAALVDLTHNGRELAGFEYDIFPLLATWLRSAYNASKAARKQASREANRPKGKATVPAQDGNLSSVFAFLKDLIKFNLRVADDNAIGLLLDELLNICVNTSVQEDLRSCISVIDAIVVFGAIPSDRLKNCIHVLSSIHCVVPGLQKDAWHTLSKICKSHNGQSTVRILLDVLRTFPAVHDNDQHVIREVRGAVSVLKKLLFKSMEKGYPSVPLELLVDGLANVSRSSSTRIAIDILKLVNALLGDSDGQVAEVAADEDWAGLFCVAARCGEKAEGAAGSSDADTTVMASDRDELPGGGDQSVDYHLRTLILRVEQLLKLGIPNPSQRDECVGFFAKVQHALPDSAVTSVLDHFRQSRYCFPSELDWESSLKLVLEGFFRNRRRRPLTRLQALEVVRDVYDFLDIVCDAADTDRTSADDIVRRILFGIDQELDTLVLQEMVSFVAAVAAKADLGLFEEIVDSLKGVMLAEHSRATVLAPASQSSPVPPSQDQTGYFTSQSLSNVVARGYVLMFMGSMNTDAAKSRKLFNAIIRIARSSNCEADARLTAMKMLFRLRADWDHRICLVTSPESEGLAKSLYRTEASFARKLAEDASQPPRLYRGDQAAPRPSRGTSFSHGQAVGVALFSQAVDRATPVRSASGAKPATHITQRLWSLPDADALPEAACRLPSPVLSSRADSEHTTPGDALGRRAHLNMASLLDTVLSCLLQGCDWEVYSFILVHLPAQLSNHTIFEGAIDLVRELRRAICEMIRTNTFLEPPSSSGLRRSDVTNCLFHSLVVIMSYHPCFQKNDEDELVRTFMLGITDKTAKTCIHALSVCCHELPMSVSKSLVTILHKMSQVITQPLVAMHILEFLACLSRLHSLYSNFREDEYRIVFGICFRYLQYAREKKRHMRSSQASEPPTPGGVSSSQLDPPAQQGSADDLPEYVYSLAYHVITFWFLALRINDRPNQIGWIAKNLFTDVDGNPSNEQQAQTTMDFMQRAAFTDANDSTEDAEFSEEHFGGMLEKRWITGNSILTIKQAKETGWAQVTRRYPSGMTSFTVREHFGPISSHQAQNSPDAGRDGRLQGSATTLPSFVLLQLVAPIPQASDPISRPIPLPEDETVDRAIRLFDRTSAVDSHKVGVIYMGENQTDEADILANTMGSPDYVEFLEGLGTLTRLKGASFNAQGLDREYDSDGKYTFCWRDRVTEIVYHVTTQMPTNPERDPQCVLKKRHIGNDFVNIIFNDSGMPFRFDTFPSEFNYVNIVITPNPRPSFVAAREAAGHEDDGGGRSHFYTVQVMSKPGFPEISPAAEPKTLSLRTLPTFVRLLALNASVFSHVWANREGGEHISSWGARLREINRLRERWGPRVQPTPSPPASSTGGGAMFSQIQQMDSSSRPASSVRDSFGSSIRRSSVATFFTSASTDPTTHRSSVFSAPATETAEFLPMTGADALVDSVDFSKWA